MSKTTVTVTEPLKEHLKTIRRKRSLRSLDSTIQSVLDEKVDESFQVEQGNMEDNPAPIKVEQSTLSLLKEVHERKPYHAYEDTLREMSGATMRDHGEQPVEWKPLER